MDPAAVPSLPQRIGAARLAPYLARYQGDAALAVRLYAWNSELSSVFWGPIGLLEVTLRNAIHDQLRRGRADDWWNNSNLVRMTEREEKAVTRAIDKLAYAGRYHPSADDVVAETAMGLWVGLLDVGYARDPYRDYETALWAPRLKEAFPHRGALGRRHIHAKLNRVRVFRNRIAHNEPVYSKQPQQMMDLVLECLGFMDADLRAYAESSHRVDEVLARQQAAVTSGDCVL